MTSANERVRALRTALGISEAELAERVGLTWSEYHDVELHPDELLTAVELGRVKILCGALGVQVSDLLSPELNERDVPRQRAPVEPDGIESLLQGQRSALGLSEEALGDLIGFDSEVVRRLEREPDYIDSFPIEVVVRLCAALHIAPRIIIEGPLRGGVAGRGGM